MTTPRPMPFSAPCDRCGTVAELWPYAAGQALCLECLPDHAKCRKKSRGHLMLVKAWTCPHKVTFRVRDEQ
jgi:hypothetical protein